MKHKHHAVYDYGIGGVWFFIWARSPGEITAKYPFLTVVEQLPPGFGPDMISSIEAHSTYDIDCEPSGVLKKIIETETAKNLKKPS